MERGTLFESLVALGVRVQAQAAEAVVRHLRTKAGDAGVRHLRWLAAALGTDLLDAVVVTTGREAYRREDGIAVVPAALLGP